MREVPLLTEGLDVVQAFCDEQGIGFTPEQYERIAQAFVSLGKNPTDVALFQLAQMWSDHCRHLVFNARIIIDGVEIPHTLFDLVRAPYQSIEGTENDNGLIVFHDNASAIAGTRVPVLVPATPGQPSSYVVVQADFGLTISGETHNYPGHVAPYPGAATEIGGEIRDQIGCGRGSDIGYSGCGRVLGSLRFPNGYRIPGEILEGRKYPYPTDKATPIEIAVRGIQGWHDYANCFGKPCTYGFFYSGAVWRPRCCDDGGVVHERIESLKPVCFGVAGGTIRREHLKKRTPTKGMLIIQIGGPAYPIGFCGGSGSSNISGSNIAAFDENAVQRGYPEMERRFYQVLLACIAMGKDSPIVTLHDQGAGGIANVLTELIEKVGGRLFIGSVRRGDPTMSDVKVWVCEYQERQGLVIRAEDLDLFRSMCERENCPLEVLGEITGDGRLVVFSERDQAEVDSKNAEPIISLPLADVLADLPPITLRDKALSDVRLPMVLPSGLTIELGNRLVLRRTEVSSKGGMLRGVDGSISGLVVVNQFCGPWQTPVNDCTVVALSYLSESGQASSLGVAPVLTTLDPAAGARMSIGEMITNLMGVAVSRFQDIQLICNWMWPATIKPADGEVARMVVAAEATKTTLQELRKAILGGKDSSSMATKVEGELVKSLATVVMSSIAPVPDVNKHITPDLKRSGSSALYLIDVANGKKRLGGSSFGQCFGQLGRKCPDLDDSDLLRRAFELVQGLIERGLVTAGHDVSAGGLLVAIEEMVFAGGGGVKVDLPVCSEGVFASAFAEELGYVFEVPTDSEEEFMRLADSSGIPCVRVGTTSHVPLILVRYDGKTVANMGVVSLRREWERTSHQFRRLRVSTKHADLEWRNTRGVRKEPSYRLTFTPRPTPQSVLAATDKPKVAVIRDQGTNGHPEVAAAFIAAGFEAWDVHMTDLEAGRLESFKDFQVLAFGPGFSSGDVLGAAVGWSLKIKRSPRVSAIFDEFMAREDTLMFGVCNGAQLGLRCGWAPLPDLLQERQPLFTLGPLGSFNHQWIRLRIEQSPAVMLRGMEGSILGAYVANGEGYFNCDHAPEVLGEMNRRHLIPLVYVDAKGRRTSALPHCPSGKYVAAVCDPTGRRLFMMPHAFDRGFQPRLWPYWPSAWEGLEVSPWLRMGQNAYNWCMEHRS